MATIDGSGTLPLGNFFSVTPNDSTEVLTRAVYVGVTGSLAFIGADDSASVTLTNLAAGIWHPIRARRILATGTTATGIVGAL